MIKPILGPGSLNTTVNPAQAETASLENVQPTKAFGTFPGLNLGHFDQNALQDVFFSDQSFRAQMFRYFKALPETPWMVSYSRTSAPSLWDHLAPPGRVALVVTPLLDENENTEEEKIEGDAENEHQQQENEREKERERAESEQEDSHEEVRPVESQALIASETLQNPFEAIARMSGMSLEVGGIATTDKIMTNEMITSPDAEIKSPNKVLLQHIYGHYLESHHYFQLGEAYEKLKEMPDQTLWVHLGEDKMDILGQEPPENYGFKRVYNDTLANVTNFIAPLAHQYFDWYHDKDFLYLPNGGMVPLRPHGWQDKQANRAALFQVKRLPNGTWFKVASIRNQATMSMRDLAEVKKTLENWNGRIEQQGWLRENTAKK